MLDSSPFQRLVPADVNGGIVLGLFPGELKATAQFIYAHHRAEAFVSAKEGGWRVRPTPHIGFWQAPPRQRLYLDPRIDLERYVALWQGPGWGRFGGYSLEELTRSVWPWLKDQGLAAQEDDAVFGEFLLFLTKLKRQAHLRAGLYAKREWKREEIAAWATPRLASEVRRAVNSVLGAIGEPRFPGA